ncbi:tRNA (adenosine(37)-N6)-dimethylallyltransferase MiaA [Treponema sp.]|uniref:tRNA (adenosine(37)-N6)-dimethylallyltransferase MiaA n=1 Tax=Treponema sp. TaxID=166 RepID=UPI00298E1786|nr:tRNA (adenosine(37)-N6)-dimethylallyltransferase MiaA [Treponema sp.]
MTRNNRIPVIVIFAPTATGKTALVEKLFTEGSPYFFKNKVEIISADSMAVYKYMDIGTAKPDKNLLQKIPHHMINLIEPDVQFSVSDFVEKADAFCEEIFSRGKIPAVCGGTGFYIRNFLLGLPLTPESNPELREKLKGECSKSGTEYMYEKLKMLDPKSAEKINKNDAYRILRALEIFYTTGKPRSDFELSKKLRNKFDFITIILERDREELYKRIDLRVEQMFDEGLEEEVESLIKKGYKKTDPGMQAIGYREFFMNLDSIDAVKEKIKTDSHKYAKKQYVFMKEIPGAVTIRASECNGDFSLKVSELLSTALGI